MARRLVLAAAAACVLAALAFAQTQTQTGRHPISGRRYAGVMGVGGADWLVRPERSEEEQPDKAIALLKIAKGATVADIGAGSGYITWRLAERWGPRARCTRSTYSPRCWNCCAATCSSASSRTSRPCWAPTTIPNCRPNSLDLAIMVDVYHEFSEPQKMLRHIREALKPDGRLVLLEYRGEDPSVPIRPEHKMTVAQVKAELEPEGYRVDRVLEDLPRQHILIFKKTP